jgi:hypothetical protein
MLDSVVLYFLLVMSITVLNSTLKSATRVLTYLLMTVSFVVTYVMGEFSEINRFEFVFISIVMAIYLLNKIVRDLDIVSELPLVFAPLLFAFDQRIEFVIVLKMVMLSVFYLYTQKKFQLTALANVAIGIILYIANIAINPTYQIEIISFLILFCLSINVLSIPKTFEGHNVLYNFMMIFLMLKILEPQLLKIDTELMWQISVVYTVFISIAVIARMLNIDFEQQQLMTVFVASHHVGHSLFAISNDKIGFSLVILLLIFLIQIFQNLDKPTKTILIILSFAFLSYEVILLNLSTISLIFSIFFKVLFVLISDLKNHHLLSRKVAII